jgi:hypothetical protein
MHRLTLGGSTSHYFHAEVSTVKSWNYKLCAVHQRKFNVGIADDFLPQFLIFAMAPDVFPLLFSVYSIKLRAKEY